MTARVLNLAAARQQARQRRTAYPAPENLGCFAMAAAVNRQMIDGLSSRSAAAMRLLSERDVLPSDTEGD